MCKRFIFGARSKANHYRNLYKHSTDPSRCDNQIVAAVAARDNQFDALAAAQVPGVGVAAAAPQVGVVMAPAATGARDLIMRLGTSQDSQREQRSTYTILPNPDLVVPPHVYNLVTMQQAYDRFRQDLFEVCSYEF